MGIPDAPDINLHKSLCVLVMAFLGLSTILDVVFYNLPLHHKSCPDLRDADDGANNASQLLAAFWLTFSLHIALLSIWMFPTNTTTPEEYSAFWGTVTNQDTCPQRTLEGTADRSTSESTPLSIAHSTGSQAAASNVPDRLLVYILVAFATFFCTMINTYLSRTSLSQDHVDQCFWNAFPSVWYRGWLWLSRIFYYVFLVVFTVALVYMLGLHICQEMRKLIQVFCITNRASSESDINEPSGV